MHLCIFSYNRGELLENCIASISVCAPGCSVTIIDDNSDDEKTQEVLREAAQRHEVINTKLLADSDKKLGGLYPNMQFAISHLKDKKTVCFLQDDMQFVRLLDENDFQNIDGYFEKNTSKAFLHQAFLKGSNRKRDQRYTIWDSENSVYFREGKKQSVGVHFSAVCILRCDRLLETNWQFKSREKENDSQAKEYFGKMGLMKNPFLIWLPNVTVYRGKKKTLGIKIAEKMHRSGFYPIEIMLEKEVDIFKSRSPEALPITEDFLKLKGKKLKKPWYHHPLAGSKLLKSLHKLEVKLKK